MDNRVFNVNGPIDDIPMLKMAVDLAFRQSGFRCSAWTESKKSGLILLWSESGQCNKLPTKMDSDAVLPMIQQWLDSDFAKTVEPDAWCGNFPHDGDNGRGWQVYCEDWGHVESNHYAICGIRPAWMWYGK